MFLVIQHVATSDQDGINAYCHAHGARDDWEWEPPAGVPDEDPGTLLEHLSHVNVTGRGRVRSYLDIAAPDGVPVSMLSGVRLLVVALLSAGARFPLVVVSGPLFVRFEVEEALRHEWRAELRRLLEVGAEVLATASHG